MDKTDDLDVLAEINKAVPTRVGNFTVHPVQMKNFKRFTALASPLFNHIMAVFKNESDIGDLIVHNEDAVVEMLMLCSDFTKEHYNDDKFYADDLTALVITLVEVNMDFFVRNLLPRVAVQVRSLVNKYEKIKGEIDQAKSSSLLASDTVLTASKSTH